SPRSPSRSSIPSVSCCQRCVWLAAYSRCTRWWQSWPCIWSLVWSGSCSSNAECFSGLPQAGDVGVDIAKIATGQGLVRRERESGQDVGGHYLRQRRLLGCEQLLIADVGQVEQAVELLARECSAFSSALYLDQMAGGGLDDIHISVGDGVLDVGEIEQR